MIATVETGEILAQILSRHERDLPILLLGQRTTSAVTRLARGSLCSLIFQAIAPEYVQLPDGLATLTRLQSSYLVRRILVPTTVLFHNASTP